MDDMSHAADSPSAPPSSAPMEPTAKLEPVSVVVPTPVPWYKKLFGVGSVTTETRWKLTFVALLIVGVFVGGRALTQQQTTVTQAAAGNARIALYPASAQVPPEKSIQLWVTVDKPVRSGTISLTFDPKAVKLSRDPVLLPKENVMMESTPVTQANATGVIDIKLSQVSEAGVLIPEGTFQLATLTVDTQGASGGASAQVAVDTTRTQILNADGIPFAVKTANASVNVQ